MQTVVAREEGIGRQLPSSLINVPVDIIVEKGGKLLDSCGIGNISPQIWSNVTFVVAGYDHTRMQQHLGYA